MPRDNPFVGRRDAEPEIWSCGHRNVQGADIHPVTGALWFLEFGPRGGDERIPMSARIRHVRQGSDGAVYLLTDELDGEILRLSATAKE